MKISVLGVALMFVVNSVYSQDIVGYYLYGADGANQTLGDEVVLGSETVVAIGSRGFNNSTGKVEVWEYSELTSWTPKGSTIPGTSTTFQGGNTGDQLGLTLSMPDENTIAISATGNDDIGTNFGAVQVYQWNGSDWEEKGGAVYGQSSNAGFGYSVSMPDANTIAVSAHLEDFLGATRIYDWNGTQWMQRGLTINGEAIQDYSGFSIDMPDENTIAISARGNDDGGTNAGHVRVYSWNGSSWQMKGDDLDGLVDYEEFGYEVSMLDVNTLAVGVPEASTLDLDGFETIAGAVRIYEWDGAFWQLSATIIGDVEDENSRFGESVSFGDADHIAIGAPHANGNGINSGRAYVYEKVDGNWVQKGVKYGYAQGDRMGRSLDMVGNKRVAVGSPEDDSHYDNSGFVGVYDFCSDRTIQTVSSCGAFTWIDDIVYNEDVHDESVTYSLANIYGCDSTVVLDLTIADLPQSDVVFNETEMLLTASNSSATYQWLNCDDNYAAIDGETSSGFAPTENGSYAVELIENGCSDTSECVVVSTLDFNKLDFNSVKVYPNPTLSTVTLDFGKSQGDCRISILDINGRVLRKIQLNNSAQETILLPEKGIYFIEIYTIEQTNVVKVVRH